LTKLARLSSVGFIPDPALILVIYATWALWSYWLLYREILF